MSLVMRTKPTRSPLDAFFNDFFEGEFLPGAFAQNRGSVPAANVRESERSYHVELAAPGMKKSDFKIEVNDDLLSIRTEKEHEQEEKGERYTKREFSYNSFVRTFRLPEEVETEKISASYEDGILRLTLPKKESAVKPAARQIEIS